MYHENNAFTKKDEPRAHEIDHGRRLRVNIVHPHGPGQAFGGCRVIFQHAQFLQEQGHEVFLVSPPLQRWRRFDSRIGRRLPFFAAPATVPDFALSGPAKHVLSEQRAVRAGDVPDADVTVATYWTTIPWVRSFPASKGVQVHFVQGEDPAMQSGPRRDEAGRAFAAPMPKIAVSRWLEEVLTERWGVQADDVRIVPNGVDAAAFYAPRTAPPVMPTLGILWAENKRCELAVEAVRRLRAEGKDVRLVGFGRKLPGVWADDFDDFRVSPTHEVIRSTYGSCTAWLFTSREEGFGLPILEAMAAGTPVIGTRAGAAPDLIDGINGSLVEADADAMAEAAWHLAASEPTAWLVKSVAATSTAAAHDLVQSSRAFGGALTDLALPKVAVRRSGRAEAAVPARRLVAG